MSDDSRIAPDAAFDRRVWDEYSAECQALHGAQLAASGGGHVWRVRLA